ncbi:ectoine/hydroxyectoine ABC transporter ATP-binding protein EhuA [Bradyrhizobium canariense]|uniref:ectoine/hydroxyectoine ABC transporter ATP-binding protein EhuA n=1 Tax=Bradyrhizobium canariense TaxID=255045 RepID=UPI000A18B34D|nr:ectoine/hydroxyectoine ABC transporter ATP-binding protein EhuA [Bradyrhizobium canariense]OSI30543.1 ectoine/hydroxyectoine ABC transporter ATP-binding protein EhuA [Bradyrhizobium canariense]OSI37304.1 ectoine/hydroxyectoine ABC transporter ATP-binding protein EhuA [Bradyrhizobium canariense]OSI52024.1 ectoine/hydroxyectoine ABC transporter ATP-binding protein EhuA [Bradyrhizobium canariense]OSI56327.1 ectoine/hydroxyectoine ABC transporter ATP-binding protein EhuA [Bradyrhizobium canarien
MIPTMVQFDGVRKLYGAYPVLSDLTFSASLGEKLALIGASGSGKTTILRILMTLEAIDGGSVTVNGRSLLSAETVSLRPREREAHLHEVRKDIGMVFQQFNLFPHMTVLRNVALAPILTQGLSKSAAEALAMHQLDLVGMAHKAHAVPTELSGGQKQRVAIARALALKPKVMLFDEVTSALDPELVEEVLNVLRKLALDTDMTMLLVTHEMSFARDFADRIIFLDGGRIVEEGAPAEIFCNPQQDRTKLFLRKIVAAGLSL